MRNLKKILSLALALMMILSVTASAAFTDAAKIDADYAEAAAVLNGMKVFQGYEDGSFQPTKAITRAEVAAIIYRIDTKDVKSEDVALYVGSANFSDVKAADWFSGYVGYCANAGYIKGYPDGTFLPNKTVTGFEALAMILRAMGYDAQNEFSGAQWSQNIAKIATKAGMLNTVKPGQLSLAGTREMIAQLLFDALANAYTVKYYPAWGYLENTTKLGDIFALAKTTTVDAWGRPSYGWTYNTGDKKTLFAETPDAKYYAAVTECQIASDVDLDENTEYTVYTNGVENTSKYIVQPLDTVNTLGAQGRLVEVYGEDRIVMIDTFLAEVEGVKNATYDYSGHYATPATITLRGYDKAEGTVFTLTNGETNYAYTKGDMVLVYAYTNNTVNNTTGAVTVSGIATETVSNVVYGEYAEILGLAKSMVGAQTFIWYNAAQHTVDGVTYNDAEWFELDQAGKEVDKHTWYFDQYGNLIGATDIETIYTYGTMDNIQWVNTVGAKGYAQATIRYMDGTTETKVVTSVDGASVAYVQDGITVGKINDTYYVSTTLQNNDTLCDEHLYRIKTASSGSVSLEHVFVQGETANVKITTEMSGAEIKTGLSAIYNGSTAIYTNENTQYLIYDDGYSWVTGYTNIASFTGAKVDYVNLNGDSYVDYVFVIGSPDAAKSWNVFMPTTNNVKAVLNSDGTAVSYYEVTGILNNVPGTVIKVANKDAMELLIGNVNKMFLVYVKDGKVVDDADDTKWSGDTNGAVKVEDVSLASVTGYTGYANLNMDYQAAGATITSDGMVMNVNGAYYNIVGLTPVVGEFASDMSDKNVYVIYDHTYTIAGAYVAKAVYIIDVASTGTDSGVGVPTKGTVTYNVTMYVGGTVVGTKTKTIEANAQEWSDQGFARIAAAYWPEIVTSEWSVLQNYDKIVVEAGKTTVLNYIIAK